MKSLLRVAGINASSYMQLEEIQLEKIQLEEIRDQSKD